jgi:hypothetical protein
LSGSRINPAAQISAGAPQATTGLNQMSAAARGFGQALQFDVSQSKFLGQSLDVLRKKESDLASRLGTIRAGGGSGSQAERDTIRQLGEVNTLMQNLGDVTAKRRIPEIANQFAALPPVLDNTNSRLLQSVQNLRLIQEQADFTRTRGLSPRQLTTGFNQSLALTRAGMVEGAQNAQFFADRINRLRPAFDETTQAMGRHARRIAEGIVLYDAFGQAVQGVSDVIKTIADVSRERIRFEAVTGGLDPAQQGQFVQQLGSVAVDTNTQMGDLASILDTVAASMNAAGASTDKFSNSMQFLRTVGEFTNVTQRDVATETDNLLGLFNLAGDESIPKFNDRLGRIVVAGKNSSSVIAEITDALNEAGRSAQQTGFDFDILTAIAADIIPKFKGAISGRELGAAINTFIGRLTDPKVVQDIEKISGGLIQVRDAAGNLRPTSDVFIDIAKSANQLSQQQFESVIDKIVPPLNPAQRSTIKTIISELIPAIQAAGPQFRATGDDLSSLSDKLVSGPAETVSRAFIALQAAATAAFSDDVVHAANGLAGAMQALVGLVGFLNTPFGQLVLNILEAAAAAKLLVFLGKQLFNFFLVGQIRAYQMAVAINAAKTAVAEAAPIMAETGAAGGAAGVGLTEAGVAAERAAPAIAGVGVAGEEAAVGLATAGGAAGTAAVEFSASTVAIGEAGAVLAATGPAAEGAAGGIVAATGATVGLRGAAIGLATAFGPLLAVMAVFMALDFAGQVDQQVKDLNNQVAGLATTAEALPGIIANLEAAKNAGAGGPPILGDLAKALFVDPAIQKNADNLKAIQANMDLVGQSSDALKARLASLKKEVSDFHLFGVGGPSDIAGKMREIDVLEGALKSLGGADVSQITFDNLTGGLLGTADAADEASSEEEKFKKMLEGLLNPLQANVDATNDLTTAEGRQAAATRLNAGLSGVRASILNDLLDKLDAGKITLDEFNQSQERVGRASDVASRFLTVLGGQLSLIPGLQERMARTGEDAATALTKMLSTGNDNTIDQQIDVVEQMIKIAEANADTAESVAANPIRPRVDSAPLVQDTGKAVGILNELTNGTIETADFLVRNPPTPRLNLSQLRSQLREALQSLVLLRQAMAPTGSLGTIGGLFGGAFSPLVNQVGGQSREEITNRIEDLRAAIRRMERSTVDTTKSTSSAELKALQRELDILRGIRDGDSRLGTAAESKPQTALVDVGDLSARQVSRAISLARTLQASIPGARKDASDETVALIRDARFLQFIRGLDQRFLAEAIQALTDVEKKRLELEQQRLQDVTRSIVTQVGPIQSIVSSPVLSAGGGLLSGQGLNADPRLGNVTINVPINWSGMSMTQLQQFIYKAISQAWLDAGRGG